MKSVVISRLGGPEVLQLVDRDLPEPKPTEARIRVLATGVAYADVLMRYGLYQGIPSLPYAPGYDVVGVIESAGRGVSRFKIGDTVAALTVTGGYSQYVALPEAELVSVPAGLDPAEAVSLVLNYTTAYQMLHRIAKVQKGARVLIHGAAGGVGTAALELGRLAGLEMYGTASRGKHELVRKLGGNPIDYKSEDFVSVVRRATGNGVDVALDPIGGSHFGRSFAALRPGGRLIGYGVSAAISNYRASTLVALGSFALLALLQSTSFRSSAVWFNITTVKKKHPDWFREDLGALMHLLAEKKVQPQLAVRLPLKDAARAHELLESAAVTGKIVLLPQE
jgi:NADPH:quinone reductase-like Zn-dependent oxidoreductase